MIMNKFIIFTANMEYSAIMYKSLLFIITAFSLFFIASCSPKVNISDPEPNLKMAPQTNITLRGKVCHFGNPDFEAGVPEVKVSILGLPGKIHPQTFSGPDGWWQINISKPENLQMQIAFLYQKSGWPTTKSNNITVNNSSITDIAIQYIDPDYYYQQMKPMVQKLISDKYKMDIPFQNALVFTVGQSWASMHSARLPHGDPGATVMPINNAIGPVYFDESVQPNATITTTSDDGGVAFFNVPYGTHTFTANKPDSKYNSITFDILPADTANNVELYIASPPYAIQLKK